MLNVLRRNEGQQIVLKAELRRFRKESSEIGRNRVMVRRKRWHVSKSEYTSYSKEKSRYGA